MLQQVCLLSERLCARVASEGLLPRVRPQVDLDVALVQETSVTYTTPMHRLLFAQKSQRLVRLEYRRTSGLLLLLLGPTPRLLRGVRGGGGGVGVVLAQHVRTPYPMLVAEAVHAVLGQEPAVHRQQQVVRRGDHVGGRTGRRNQLPAVVRGTGRLLLYGRPVLQSVLQEGHVAVREEGLKGGPALLRLDLGCEFHGLRRLRELAAAGYHELRQALLRDYDALLLVHAGAVDPRVQVHPAVSGTRGILTLRVVVRNCGVRYGGAYDRRYVFYGGDVVLRYFGFDVGGRVHRGMAAALVLDGRHRVRVHTVRVTFAREESLPALFARGVRTHVTSRTRHYVLFVVAVVGVVVLLGDSLGYGVIVVALDAVYAQVGGVARERGQWLQLRQTVQRLRT